MKRFFNGRPGRLSRSSLHLAVTALCVVAVLLLNLAFSALSSSGLWFIDLTTYVRESQYGTEVYEHYTLTPGLISLLDDTFADLNASRQNKGEEPVAVDIVFCDDPDNLMAAKYQRMIYLAALQMQKAFPDTVTVSHIDIYKNPSAVQRYKTNSYTTVYPSTVIVSSGTEFRRLSVNSFFHTDSTTGEVWAARVEVAFASAIRAVTKAAAPKCVLLGNHGESGYTDALLSLLHDAGYEVIPDFDLEKQDVPTDCRLMICVAPTEDFKGYREIQAGQSTVSEIAKLDAFLDDENALMVFFNAETPVLPTFEEYLEKWGVRVLRHVDEAGDATGYLVKDSATSLSDDGQTLVADYVTQGLGASFTSDMQSQGYPAKVIFRNATAIGLSPLYHTSLVDADEDEGFSEPFSFGAYSLDGTYRSVFDVFRSPESSVAYAGDRPMTDEETGEAYSLMTVAQESVTAPGDRNGYTTVSHDSYVIACASTDFLCDELLATNAYGNADMLAGVLRTLGTDPMSALIEQYLLPLGSESVEGVTVASATKKNVTLALCLIPAAVLFGLGIYVTTKRRHS